MIEIVNDLVKNEWREALERAYYWHEKGSPEDRRYSNACLMVAEHHLDYLERVKGYETAIA